MVHGPYSDFRLMAANRKVSDALRKEALGDKLVWQDLAGRTQRLADSLRTQVWVEQEKGHQKDDMLGISQGNLMACREKNAKLSGWATVGKVWTIALGGSVLGLTTIAVIHAVRP